MSNIYTRSAKTSLSERRGSSGRDGPTGDTAEDEIHVHRDSRNSIWHRWRKVLLLCYTENAPNTWHRQGTQRQRTPTINTSDRQYAQLTDQAPGASERAAQESHNTNQHSSHARLHHSNLLPLLRTPSRVIARPSRPTQPSANHRLAEPNNNTDTTSSCVLRLSDQAYHPGPVYWVEQRAKQTVRSKQWRS